MASEYVVVHLTREQARVIIDACEKRAEFYRHRAEESVTSDRETRLIAQAEECEGAATLVNNELISAGD